MKSELIFEEWRPVPHYEGLYDASSFGRVRSLNYNHTGKVKILKPCKTRGYLQVDLWKDGKVKKFLIHRLVWEAFHGEIPEGYEVNHITEDKTDNRLESLNLLSHKDNVRWGTGIQRRAEKRRGMKAPWVTETKSEPVLQLTLDGTLVKEWPSAKEAERNGFYSSNISKCCCGERKSHRGFIWQKKIV